jgi:hypothetical protein
MHLATMGARELGAFLLASVCPGLRERIQIDQGVTLAAKRRETAALDGGAAQRHAAAAGARYTRMLDVLEHVSLPERARDSLDVPAVGAARALDQTVHGVAVATLGARIEQKQAHALDARWIVAEHLARLAQYRDGIPGAAHDGLAQQDR